MYGYLLVHYLHQEGKKTFIPNITQYMLKNIFTPVR
jgi:hypothetical protein